MDYDNDYPPSQYKNLKPDSPVKTFFKGLSIWILLLALGYVALVIGLKLLAALGFLAQDLLWYLT